MDYILQTLILIGIFIILAASLDLLAGHTGLVSVAHAAFYGIGAYTSALLTIKLGAPFLLAVVASMLVAAAVSFLVSIPSLRLHDDYFVIATFGFQMILSGIFTNWTQLTGGTDGIKGIPRPALLGLTIQSNLLFFLLVMVMACLAFFAVNRITTSPLGRVLRAIREDEIFASSLGKNALQFKVIAFGVSAALAAVAGSLYSHFVTYIDPTSFTVMESILIIAMVIIGGAGSKWGPILGAVLLVSLPEALRFLGFNDAVAANIRQLLYGASLVIIIVLRSRGLAGRYVFRR